MDEACQLMAYPAKVSRNANGDDADKGPAKPQPLSATRRYRISFAPALTRNMREFRTLLDANRACSVFSETRALSCLSKR